MRDFRLAFLAIFSLFLISVGVSAQETQTRVVDEVVAQVNNDVITLSRIKREKKSLVESLVQEGKKSDEAEKLVNEKEGELIANLVNEELLVQKAKEMGMDADVEAQVNQRFMSVMKEYNLKTLEALYAEMAKSGVDPQDLRETWRKQATREMVIQRQIQQKIYWEPTTSKLKDYYEKHKTQFTKPETVSFSEIFISFAGRDEKVVREKAKQTVAQLKGGADFAKIAKDNDAGIVTQGAGKAEKVKVNDMPEILKKALKDVKPGEFSEPFEADQLGMVILRVDDRQAASDESMFDESAVRVAILNERFPDEQKKFFAKLREDALIKINDTYRPLVSPILFAEERKDKPAKTNLK